MGERIWEINATLFPLKTYKNKNAKFGNLCNFYMRVLKDIESFQTYSIMLYRLYHF